ncbi:MAG: hydrogenase formation protein HypD [Acidobacteria bacterium]|nr:hydrogenase formation protein HypD [Acidobacteriota bacterium]MCB9397629.1 hydrogenase formation protein HypD [Acidobacteriota bacterium]
MKYIDEFRNPELVKNLAQRIQRITTKPWVIMEVCGGQTHSILKYGIQQLIPSQIELVHGPGCPVCVTPLELIDKALFIARQPDVIFTTFGDMMRVPGSEGDLFRAKSEGADIRMLYSPLDALEIARKEPEKKVVFFAVGFETTAPTHAMAVYQASREGLGNFAILSSHVLVSPAMTALLESEENRVQGYLAAGHVCTIMGTKPYEPIAHRYKVPIVVTGFEPTDVLEGIFMVVLQLEQGRHEVQNQYKRSVRPEGNLDAQALMDMVFEIRDRPWRGVGTIPQSGLVLRPGFADHDAEKWFDLSHIQPQEPSICQSGRVLQGLMKPTECPAFGKQCTPQTPLGATMVSQEGACAAYFHYGTWKSQEKEQEVNREH